VLTWLVVFRTPAGLRLRSVGENPLAAETAGLSPVRIRYVAVAISGALAAIGGASQIGDFGHVLDPRGLQQQALGYTGIVVAALARFNPLAVPVVALVLGGLTNAGFALQGADFPNGMIGILQGALLLCTLAGEVLGRYRVRSGRRGPAGAETEPAAGEVSAADVVLGRA
jgi:simple sugar transport system permease protein